MRPSLFALPPLLAVTLLAPDPGGVGAGAAARPTPAAGASAARELLAGVNERMGLAAFEEAGFIQLGYAGTYDESVERGGFEPEPPAPVRDSFAIDLKKDSVGWDSEGRRGDGTVRWRRFLYPEPDLFLRIDVPTKWAALARSDVFRAERPRMARMIPHALLREMTARPDSVRLLPAVRRGGETRKRLAYTTPDGDVLELLIDAEDRLDRVEIAREVPFVGDRRLAWVYGGWTRERGVLIPKKLTMLIGDQTLRPLTLESTVWSRDASMFALPEGIAPAAESPGPASLPPAPLTPSAKKIADGVWQAPDVRPGINGYFIEHPDGITAFEAPAGFLYPQMEMPPPNLARGRRSSEPGEAFVDLIKRTLPGRPIRRVVVSHAHPDHAGGVRAFAAEGAEILVPSGAAAPVRRFLAERFALSPDRWEKARGKKRVAIREVGGRESIGSGSARAEVIRVAENPHSRTMAVVWLPAQRVVLQGDLFYADPLASFPAAGRVGIMKWFAAWLEREKLEPERIYGTHTEGPGTREHLEKLKNTPD